MAGNAVQQDVQIVDQVLSQYAQDFRNSDYIGHIVAPPIPVTEQSAKYVIWNKDDLFRSAVQRRAPGTEYPRIKQTFSTDSYFADISHLAYDIPDEVRATQHPSIDLEKRGSRILADQFILQHELELATEMFASGLWGTDEDGDTSDFTQWDDLALSNPINDVKRMKRTMRLATGYEPNQLVMGPDVTDVLIDHPLFLERYKHNPSGLVLDINMIAKVLRIPQIVSGRAIVNTANDSPSASFTGNFIWDDDVLALHVKTGEMEDEPNAMTSFMWTGVGSGDFNVSIVPAREENRDTDVLKAKSAWDHKPTAVSLGFYMENALS